MVVQAGVVTRRTSQTADVLAASPCAAHMCLAVAPHDQAVGILVRSRSRCRKRLGRARQKLVTIVLELAASTFGEPIRRCRVTIRQLVSCLVQEVLGSASHSYLAKRT